MIYPVGITKSREEFLKYWYLAQTYGVPSIHEGIDINRRTGGNTDLYEPVYAITAGDIVYSHNKEHYTRGYGRHIIMKIVGPWDGPRWVTYSHLDAKDFLDAPQHVYEGQQIGTIGKSGTTLAHLHLGLIRVDPMTIGGIDSYPRTRTELLTYWEDPLAFIERWYQPSNQPLILDETIIPQINNMSVRDIRNAMNDFASRMNTIKTISGG